MLESVQPLFESIIRMQTKLLRANPGTNLGGAGAGGSGGGGGGDGGVGGGGGRNRSRSRGPDAPTPPAALCVSHEFSSAPFDHVLRPLVEALVTTKETQRRSPHPGLKTR